MSLFFTADPHYDDDYILEFTRKQFENVDVMNKTMLSNCICLTKNDTLIVIGDFCSRGSEYLNVYRKLLSKIRGKKILVLGNHDKLDPFQYIDVGFYSVHTHLEMTIDGIDVVIVHNPSYSCIDRSKLFLCGHTHDLFKVRKNVISLCVELWNYTPVKWDTIKMFYNNMKEGNFGITI